MATIATSINDLNPDQRFELLWAFVERRVPLYIVGPAGSGKSYIGLKIMRKFSEKYLSGEKIVWLREIDESDVHGFPNTKALYISGSANVTKLDLLGGRLLLGGEYIRKPGILNYMVENGGIVFLDEVSSLPPQFTILLNEIIDMIYRGEAHENFYIFFAGNPSYYLGANDLPDALLERVVGVWFDYYSFSDEVKIVLDMVKSRLSGEAVLDEAGFVYLVQYIVSLLRKIREGLNTAGENCPISVRSMSTAIIGTILMSRATAKTHKSEFSKVSVYSSFRGMLPDNLLEVWDDATVKTMFEFMEKYGIGWNHVKEAVRSLGVLQKIKDKSVVESVLSSIPE